MVITKNDMQFKADIDFNSEEAVKEFLEEITQNHKESQPILVCPAGVVDIPKKIVEDKGIPVTVMTFDEFKELNPDVDLSLPICAPNFEDMSQNMEHLYHKIPTVEESYTKNMIQQIRDRETAKRKESEKWARRNWKRK